MELNYFVLYLASNVYNVYSVLYLKVEGDEAH